MGEPEAGLTGMPQLVRFIDEIARERAAPVLLLEFSDGLGMMAADRAKRQEVLDRLDAAQIAWEACGPPANSGWLSYLGHIALEVRYEPGGPAYEAVRRMFEDEGGEMLDPEVKLLLFGSASAG